MEPLNLAVCDDLPEEREALLALLEQAPIATICTQFGSSEDLLEMFCPGKFDLLLMDIYMDGMTGVEAVQKIREMDKAIPIAFTTTSTDHTLESYRLSVLKYLEKPVQQKEIDDLLRLVKLQKDSAPRLAIQQNGKTQKLPLSELMVLEQQGHHVVLSLKGGSTIQLYGKLSDLLPQLEQDLVAGGYDAQTPAAIVYKATWPDEKVCHCTVSTLAQTAEANGIYKTALILVGDFLGGSYERSKLYDPAFTTEYRQGKSQ